MGDSTGEQIARDALRKSVTDNMMEVALAGETITLLRSEIRQAVSDGISHGLSEGLPKALTDENAEKLFAAFFKAMQKQATVKTGRWVLGGLSGLASKAMWLLFAMVVLYNVGGWAAIKAAWAAMQSHNGG